MYSPPTRPKAISHRGIRARAPENSIPAFRHALEAGADAIELDVHASRDGILFVHHDAAIAGLGAISELDSGGISSSPLASELRIPTLDDVLAAVGDRAGVYIEIKAAGIERDVARCIRRHSANIANYAVHSFDHRASKRMLELLPSLRTGVLQVSYPIDSCAVMRASGATDLWQHADFIDSSLVTDVRACGGRVIAWTVNVAAEWTRLAEMGVYGICSDRVDEYVLWRDAR
ncbi:MAG: glycerophosphodiester phosphodiesterase [Gemmatimonadaceae bacterium]